MKNGNIDCMGKKSFKIMCVILARGGSKGLPGKNIIDFGGKPLIAYSIEAALESCRINLVNVTTDSEEIRQVAFKYGAEAPFLRPAELATDTAHTPNVVAHAVNYYKEHFGQTYDIVITLQPTSPFRNGRHIDEALDEFLKDPSLDSLISIKPQEYPPWWMFRLEDNRLRSAFPYKEGVNVFNLERQQFPAIYRPNGAIYVCWTGYLEETGSIVNPDNNGYYVMRPEDSIDIDTPADLYSAEFELGQRQRKDPEGIGDKERKSVIPC